MSKIAVVVSEWSQHRPEVFGGIIDFALSTADWNIQHFQSNIQGLDKAIAVWGADGILFCADKSPRSILALPGSLNVPLVSVGTANAPFPAVIADSSSLARLALEHLEHHRLDKLVLISRLASPGRSDEEGNSQTSIDSVDSTLLSLLSSQLGDRFEHLAVAVEQDELISAHPNMSNALRSWIARVQSCGVIVSCDQLAAYTLRIARQLAKNIPAEMSIISLRDSYVCGLPTTSVSAVVEPFREMGYQSARLLHRLLEGHPPPSQPLQIPAEKVNSRLTTVAPTLTQAISRALRFIEENATRGISVSDVMTFQQTSRVTFERNFREAIGCPPGEQIRKIRMAHAERLLTTTDISIAEVGKQCGFDTIAKFSTFFKNACGISPLKYRQQRRTTSDDKAVFPESENINQ